MIKQARQLKLSRGKEVKFPDAVETAFSLFDTPKQSRARLQSYRIKYADLLKPGGSFAATGIAYMLRTAAQEEGSDSLRILLELADSAMRELFNLAQLKNIDAVLGLLKLLQRRTYDFYVHARDNPELAKILAQKSEAWPVLLYRRKHYRKTIENFVFKQLELGKEFPLNLSGKTSSNIEHHVAKRIYDRIYEYRTLTWSGELVDEARALPKFTRATASVWWTVAEKLFEEFYGKKCEQHKQFKHWLKKRQYAEESATRIRADIKKEIHRRFLRLAPRS
jgi:hypothetical protein